MLRFLSCISPDNKEHRMMIARESNRQHVSSDKVKTTDLKSDSMIVACADDLLINT